MSLLAGLRKILVVSAFVSSARKMFSGTVPNVKLQNVVQMDFAECHLITTQYHKPQNLGKRHSNAVILSSHLLAFIKYSQRCFWVVDLGPE